MAKTPRRAYTEGPITPTGKTKAERTSKGVKLSSVGVSDVD